MTSGGAGGLDLCEHESTRTNAVAVVTLRGPLRALAGGTSNHDVDGDTVAELLRELEQRHAALNGWIVDERGLVRRHINVFVNGEYGTEDTPVGPDDRVDVLPAISGG
jgi:sulfur-carrier protein